MDVCINLHMVRRYLCLGITFIIMGMCMGRIMRKAKDQAVWARVQVIMVEDINIMDISDRAVRVVEMHMVLLRHLMCLG